MTGPHAPNRETAISPAMAESAPFAEKPVPLEKFRVGQRFLNYPPSLRVSSDRGCPPLGPADTRDESPCQKSQSKQTTLGPEAGSDHPREQSKAPCLSLSRPHQPTRVPPEGDERAGM